MTDAEIDYAAVFQGLPGMVALLTPDLVYADANEEFLRMSGRTREQVVGRFLFDVFPDNPNDPAATGMRNLETSLRRVLSTGERDTMALQRYDVESTACPGKWDQRYWSPVNAPVVDPDGKVVLLVHRVEEVTELIRARGGSGGSRTRVLEAELYTRARELQEVNERLRSAHAREREVALALQEGMLPTHRQGAGHQIAVRYRPAVGSLNVCGDWYDVVDLVGGNRIGVSVGDIVGHGLAAAGVMGQLRSALSATSASRTARPRPWTSWAGTPTWSTAPSPPRWSRPSSTSTATPSPTAAPGTHRPPWSIPTAAWNSWTGPPTRPSMPAPTRCPDRRPPPRSPAAPPWSSTPTV